MATTKSTTRTRKSTRKSTKAAAMGHLFQQVIANQHREEERAFDDYDYDRLSRREYEARLREIRKETEETLRFYGFRKQRGTGNWVY